MVVASSVPGVYFLTCFWVWYNTFVLVSLHLGLRLVVAPSAFDVVFVCFHLFFFQRLRLRILPKASCSVCVFAEAFGGSLEFSPTGSFFDSV